LPFSEADLVIYTLFTHYLHIFTHIYTYLHIYKGELCGIRLSDAKVLVAELNSYLNLIKPADGMLRLPQALPALSPTPMR
jgi:hypothetical protein